MEIVVGGGEKLYSQNLRDFLRIKEEDHQRNLNQSTSSSSGGGRHSSSGLTLSAVLSEKPWLPPPVVEPPPPPPLRRIQSNRTLLDIIREDQTTGLGRGRGDSRSSWRHLRDKIRLRRRVSGVPIPSSDVNNNRTTMTTTIRHSSTRLNSNIESSESTQPDIGGPSSQRNPRPASGRFEQTSSLPMRRSVSEENRLHENEERSGGTAEREMEGEDSPEQPVRTSLMALLAENDRQMGCESSAYTMDEDEDDDDDVEETAAAAAAAGDAVNGVEYNSCCVCMVRHKGAAFIPCGHTFCRLCSRELWVQRGNCPLCNNYILEILDIF